MSIQFLVLMIPVILGMMGFALDLGRLYLVRAELNQAATTMAIAAASRLNGTIQASATAGSIAQSVTDDTLGTAAKFNFGSVLLGDSSNFLQSTTPQVSLFATAADAIASVSTPSANVADGTTARHVVVNVTAEAPLLYWALLALGQTRKTTIAAAAVAGVSAPVCTACAIVPMAVAAISTTDTVDFGFTAATRYSFNMQCTGGGQPGLLAGAAVRLPYLIIDRYDASSAYTEDQQLFKDGAQGMLYSPNVTQCSTIGTTENIWATAAPRACNAGVAGSVLDYLCGISTRMDDNTPAGCSVVTDVATVATSYNQDIDQTDLDDYTQYVGNNRRVITVAIVDALSSAASTMNVLGFRQFLLEPNQGTTVNNPSDANGRFVALYLGTVMPVQNGSFGGTCGVTSGPGKVVIHR